MLLLTFLVNVFTMTQIQVQRDHIDRRIDNYGQTVVATVIAFSIFNKRGYTLPTVIICIASACWYETVLMYSFDAGQLDRDTNYPRKAEFNEADFPTSIYLNYIGIPVFTLIFAAYVYWDELFDKIGFLLLDKRIKEYKKLRAGVQKLVPEIVRKFLLKKDHNVEISH